MSVPWIVWSDRLKCKESGICAYTKINNIQKFLHRKNFLYLCTLQHGAISSVGRAPDCGSGCRGFEPHIAPEKAGLRKPAFSVYVRWGLSPYHVTPSRNPSPRGRAFVAFGDRTFHSLGSELPKPLESAFGLRKVFVLVLLSVLVHQLTRINKQIYKEEDD